LFDMLMSLYRIDHRSKKWYRRIFYWSIHLGIVNGWLIYRRHCDMKATPAKEQLSLIQFTAAVSESLISEKKVPSQLVRKRGRPSVQSTELCTDNSAAESSANGVTEQPKKRASAQHDPSEVIRKDTTGHLPEHAEPKQRCRVCHSYVRMKCVKCKVYLCVTKDRNCYIEYHM